MKKIKDFFDKLNNSKCFVLTMMCLNFLVGLLFVLPLSFVQAGVPEILELFAGFGPTSYFFFFFAGAFAITFFDCSFEYLGRYKDIKRKEKEQN